MPEIPYHTGIVNSSSVTTFITTLVEAVTGTSPTTPDGDAWSVVECYDGTIREVPAGGLLSNCASAWAPGGGVPPAGSWIVLQSAGSVRVSNVFQVYFELRSGSASLEVDLYPLANFVTGGGLTANPTKPTIRTNLTNIVPNPSHNKFMFVWDADVIAYRGIGTGTGILAPCYLGALDVYDTSSYSNDYPFVHYQSSASTGWDDGVWQMHQPELGTLKTAGKSASAGTIGTGEATTSILQYKIAPVEVYFGGANGFYGGTARHIGHLQYYKSVEAAGVYLLSTSGGSEADWMFLRDTTASLGNNACMRHNGSAYAGSTARTRFGGWTPGDDPLTAGTPVTDPPVIAFVTTGAINASDDIIVDVTDDSSLEDVVISATYTSGTQVVYTPLGFTTGYTVGSTTGAISGGTRFTLANDSGWFENVTITVRAIDDGANVTTDNEVLTVTGGLGYPASVIPGVSPTINWITAAGAHASASPVVVEVTDDLNYVDATIWVTYGATKQLIHSQGEFASRYSGSVATPISGGYSFSLTCIDGWYEDMTLHVLGSDQYGNSTLDTRAFTVADGLGLPLEVFGGSPPVITWITAPGSIAAATSVTVEVTDDLNYEDATIWAVYGATKHLVYSRGEYTSLYSGSSDTPISGGTSFTLVCDAGWFTSFSLYVMGIDAADNTSTSFQSWTVSDGPGLPVVPGVADAENPTLGDISPSSLSSLRKLDPVSFTISDNSGYVLTTAINVEFADGRHEVVYDGSFSRSYAAASRRVATLNGFRYTLRRAGGWPSDPTIWAIVFDRTGNSLRLEVT